MFGWRTKPTALESLFEALESRDSEQRYQALLEAQELTSEQLAELVRIAKRSENVP